jgi:hypothetical protein
MEKMKLYYIFKNIALNHHVNLTYQDIQIEKGKLQVNIEQNINNYERSLIEQNINNYERSLIEQNINNYERSLIEQNINNYERSLIDHKIKKYFGDDIEYSIQDGQLRRTQNAKLKEFISEIPE